MSYGHRKTVQWGPFYEVDMADSTLLSEKNKSSKTVTLHDISQLKNPNLSPTGLIRKEIQSDGLILLYCDNLEVYQGVDLLVESFPYVVKEGVNVELVIIGGIPEDIDFYIQKSKESF